MTTLLDGKTASANAASPPTYSSVTEVELSNLSRSTSSSSRPPTYDDATTSTSSAIITTRTVDTDASVVLTSLSATALVSFTPTTHFQIETSGKQWLSLPTGTRPDPIPVYRVEEGSWTPHSTPAYTSLRFSRGDSSCHLVRGDDASQTPVCTTLYRFGPGKPPVFRLPRQPPSQSSASDPSSPTGTLVSEQEDEANEELDLPIVSKSITSRTQVLKTPHGTFQWRYASRKERAAVPEANQLLVCELVQKVALEGGKHAEEKTRIAQLIRGEGTRSRGSGRTTAGNGGRLMVDLFKWTELKDGSREVAEGLIVASCICMLKKEVDRRRMQQIMILGAGVGGAL
ncbi:hypothetical protein CMUS01_03214 [Colletotrichum musicola]|uniref:Uncharacterized protein n=1 Tax=Colletotrichum musicola TaxID=2175873 RepID=A0A8H6U6E1_9PEZI|nr:hypothetical protein CMUS01_03214 [Colletotrichum musicola]